MIRGDLSNRLIHLTRGTGQDEAAKTFSKIIKEQKLLGSNKGIRGGHKCVCFFDTPLSELTQVMAVDSPDMRYRAFGVMVSKRWLFERGGRPVIYQPESEFEDTGERQQFRHVRYDPTSNNPNDDHTWEREWRVETDSLELSPDNVTLIVPTRQWEKRLHDNEIMSCAITSKLAGTVVTPSNLWHFICLADLGFGDFESYPNPSVP